jgi:carboxypeptidase Q
MRNDSGGAPHRHGRRVLPALAVLGLLAAVTAAAAAQKPAPADAAVELDKKLIAGAKADSQILANLKYLCDEIGPRLTSSAALKRANLWAAERMKAHGLVNVRLEPWSIPEGWQRGHARARIVEPDNGRSLSVASMGWHPGTPGKVQGDVVVLKASDSKELAAYKGKLKGAVVLLGPPAKLPALKDPDAMGGQLGAGPDPGKGAGKKGKRSFEGFFAFRKERAEFLVREGAAGVLSDAGKHFGLLFTSGGWQGKDRPSAGNRLPTLAVAHNHYELLYRLATRPAPARTRVELDVSNTFVPGPLPVHNTVGEIRGKEKPDELVVVGAHLDSWDLGQGATDNGTGTAVVLEAARVLAKCGTPPRRTIRFVLFTGEEQGLHGSRAYVQKHKDELPRTSACLVHDTGTGKVVGLGGGGRPAVRELLEKELVSLKPLGLTDFPARVMGGSDHASFNRAGVPGFIFKQERAGYQFTHHSQADTFDRVREADLVQGAQVMAVAAMRLANLPELLPRVKK